MNLYHAADNALISASPFAFVLALLFGVMSSVGPCMASRYTALAACGTAARRPVLTSVVFLGGTVAAYTLFGFATGLLLFVQAWATVLYLLVSVGLVGFGAWMALSMRRGPSHGHDHALGHESAPNYVRSLSGVFVFGFASAGLINPCCAPFLGLVIAEASRHLSPWYTAGVLAVFGIGHGVPLLFYGSLGGYFMLSLERLRLGNVARVATAAMLMGTGVYYGLLV